MVSVMSFRHDSVGLYSKFGCDADAVMLPGNWCLSRESEFGRNDLAGQLAAHGSVRFTVQAVTPAV